MLWSCGFVTVRLSGFRGVVGCMGFAGRMLGTCDQVSVITCLGSRVWDQGFFLRRSGCACFSLLLLDTPDGFYHQQRHGGGQEVPPVELLERFHFAEADGGGAV